ncbi:L-asparaginase-like [Anneissia japonica]|uniref:L-asparaginase-like n=1 Tax=Anneissia japonica TaxID=1529436 RepID=UPI001425602A|nr:L-asparaginase-like [Anneissia japonica]XP_033104901.1 L-asparaginase-like [Anneissia japonica]
MLVQTCGDDVYVPQKDFFSQAVRRNPTLHDAEYAEKLRRCNPTLGETYALPLCNAHNRRVLYCICEYPVPKDSCNITMDDWVEMVNDIRDNYEKFDGFVIIHGTDTMSYTSSALSFMFENLGKPVILTGSQVPLEETRSDGRENLLGALYLAGHYVIPEVTLYFDYKLFRGNRVTKLVNNELDAFGSPNLDPLVRMEIEVVVDWDSLFRSKSTQKFKVHTNLNCNVGLLRLFPCITVQTVRSFLQPPMQGVVLQTYGAGNGPSDHKELLDEFKAASDRGVLILNCTQCVKGVVSNSYETGKALIDVGVIPGADINPEAALAKLGYVLGKQGLTRKHQLDMLQRNLRGEIQVSNEEVKKFSLDDSKFIQAVVETLNISNSQEVKSVSTALFPVLMCAAAKNGDLTLLKQYASMGGNLNLGDYDQRTPLHMAAREGHVDIVTYLLENGCSIYARDCFGNTPYMESIRCRNFEVIKLIRQTGGHFIRETTQEIASLLCRAVELGDVDGLKAFHIADVNFNNTDYTGRTALHVAVTLEQIDCIKYLLSHGADIHTVDQQGLTPLKLAEKLDHKCISELMKSSNIHFS